MALHDILQIRLDAHVAGLAQTTFIGTKGACPVPPSLMLPPLGHVVPPWLPHPYPTPPVQLPSTPAGSSRCWSIN